MPDCNCAADSHFRTSSFSLEKECIEVAFAADHVHLRNSRRRQDRRLSFPDRQWADFLRAIGNGDFDRP